MNTNYINTSQNVELNYPIAEIGSRVAAYILDLIFLTCYYVIFFLIFAFLIGNDIIDPDNKNTIAALLLIGLVIFLPAFCYSLWAPYFMQGQTFGKKITNIKIIRMDGEEATFGNYLARWLLNIVDFGLVGIWLGFLVMATSQKRQRIADMVAKTVVISTRKTPATILPSSLPQNYQPKFNQVLQLSDKDIQIIKSAYSRSQKTGDSNTIKKLRDKIESVINEYKPEMSDTEYVKTVLNDYDFYAQR